MKMLFPLLLLNSLSLIGCGPSLFSSSEKKKSPANPLTVDAQELQVRETLLNAPIEELYKTFSYIADDNGFSVASLEFEGIRSRLQSMLLEAEKMSDKYPTYKQFLQEQGIPEKNLLTVSEKQEAVTQAYQIFQKEPLVAELETSEADSAFPSTSASDDSKSSKVKITCVTERFNKPIKTSSFYACAKIAAREGVSRVDSESLDTILGWAWNRGECGVTMASELYNLVNRVEEQTRCNIGLEPEAPAAQKKVEVKK